MAKLMVPDQRSNKLRREYPRTYGDIDAELASDIASTRVEKNMKSDAEAAKLAGGLVFKGAEQAVSQTDQATEQAK